MNGKARRYIGVLVAWASLVTGLGALGLMDLHAVQEKQKAGLTNIQALQDAQYNELAVETGQRCISAWEQRPELRALVVQSANESATAATLTILEVARARREPGEEPLGPEVEKAIIDETVRQLEPVVDRLVDAYPDPECDLAEARDAVERGG